MRKPAAVFFSSVILMQLLGANLHSDASGESIPTPDSNMPQPAPQEPAEAPKIAKQAPTTPFKAFTGKITKNKVRVRLQPNLDGPILREFNKDELVIVLGETDEFFAIQPPKEVKAYVFRTFILDNVVEGTRVNVRLEPDLEAPIIAQLNQGERIQGTISPTNSKWLEIAMPNSARLFISKEYVEKAGDPSMMATFERRRDEVNYLLNTSYAASQTELQKPFEEINVEGIVSSLKKIINSYSEFNDQVARAKEILAQVQESYTQKKIAYLEAKAKAADAASLRNRNDGQNTAANEQPPVDQQPEEYPDEGPTSKMTAWETAEKAFYDSWAEENNNLSQDTFYEVQAQDAVPLTGVIEPYQRNVKNRPGDYVLVNKGTNTPIAYLYSTKVNLQRQVGKEVKMQGLARPNNNFAFPAYFIFSVE